MIWIRRAATIAEGIKDYSTDKREGECMADKIHCIRKTLRPYAEGGRNACEKGRGERECVKPII